MAGGNSWDGAKPRRALALAFAALLGLPAAAPAAEEAEALCVRVTKQETAGEGPDLRMRGEVTNTCPYVVRNVIVRVEVRDKDGQVVGTGEGFPDQTVLGAQEVARFDLPAPATAAAVTFNATATWRRLGRN